MVSAVATSMSLPSGLPTLAPEMLLGFTAGAWRSVVLDGEVLGIILLTAACGLFVGAIPGLTATMAVALLVPLTYFLDATQSLAAIVTLVACAIFAGDIPATLVRIPGTPSSAAYCNDAYALTRQGRHREALAVSLVFSVIGGIFGSVVLMTAAPFLAQIAYQFTSYEYFWLALLGLSCSAIVAHGSPLKGALALLVGLLLSTVGLSDVHGTPRFLFGLDPLIDGVNFIPAMIGLFGLSEVLRNALRGVHGTFAPKFPESPQQRFVGAAFALWWRRKFHALRSSAIGTLVGILPGAGADIGAWVSLAVSKRFARDPSKYGKGSLEGIGDATGANNAALGGAWVPALVFGIPGDSVTAIVLGVLLMKNVKPGPDIFEKQPDLLASVYLIFVVANLVLLPLGALAIRGGSHLIRLPRGILLPLILFFCVVGAFAIYNDPFDIWILLAMGLLGFTLEAFQVPLGPVVLGLILGGDLERYFVQGMAKGDGSAAAFFSRPIAAGLALFCLALWALPVVVAWRRRARRS